MVSQRTPASGRVPEPYTSVLGGVKGPIGREQRRRGPERSRTHLICSVLKVSEVRTSGNSPSGKRVPKPGTEKSAVAQALGLILRDGLRPMVVPPKGALQQDTEMGFP